MKPDSGWYVNEALLAELLEEVPTDLKKLEKKLCDIDIREYGDPCLSNCMNKEVLNGPVVLQLIRFRNVSQPKVKEDVRSSSDVARLSLTDGHTSTSALLLENIKGLNSDTPPGTKLLITGTAPVENGFVILAPRNVAVIGGRVEKLIEKWTIERPRTSNNNPVKQPRESGYPSRQQVNPSSDARKKGDSNYKRDSKPEREQRRLPPQSASYGTNRDRNEKSRNANATNRENYMENNRPQQRVQKSQQRPVTSPQYTARSENYLQKTNGLTNNRNEYPPSASSAGRSQGSRRDFNSSSQYPRELLVNDFSHMHLDGGPRRFESKKPFPSKNNPSLNPQFTAPAWKVGDHCRAPWNDGMYYSATIVNLGPADMCAVRYDDYGNIGTVPQAVLLLV
ncbi:unnamed protein product [Haemonchus placei]|uniref:Tudor domain-containing protein n=1 Tax=Haemonchus placei TaxID=6290 RepID=A0A158QR82_HAEPC|nr:unnamed protein product [Haemonchus placei]